MVDVVAEFLSSYPEETRAIIGKLRDMARKAMHGAHEFLYYDTVTYSHSDSPLERVCYISPAEGYVTFGFLFGASLEDQQHLLQGIGKRARHLKVRTLEEAMNPALKELVKAAWALPATSMTTITRPKRKRTEEKKRRAVVRSRTKSALRSRPRRRRRSRKSASAS